MNYHYWLPDENGKKIEYCTEKNAVIVIGANGSGKSKLGAWIEQESLNEVHRIGAQRKLSFNENIPLKNYTEAQNWVFYGDGDAKDHRKGQRWNWGHYTTNLLNDFDYALSALIALKNKENNEFAENCKNKGINKIEWPDPPTTAIDKLIAIWEEILPQRRLVEDDSRFYASFDKDGNVEKYSATEMSDGERAVLYLAAQVLCVPENKIMIIDEPEIHLHRSIMNRLWKTLEKYRTDCLFIYITHDLQFAAAHGKIDKYWVKDYDGKHWHHEKISDESLPEELTLEILGSRRNVLFVEGEKNSFDFQLYRQLYPDYLIIPCGGCLQVIERTKAFRKSSSLHDCKVYGLVDRDYRTDYEIEILKQNDIYVLGVAEVENLFLTEELITLMASRFGVSDIEKAVNTVKDYVIHTKFANEQNHQICESVVAEIKYQLSCIEIDNKNEKEARETLKRGLEDIDYNKIQMEKEAIFKKALTDKDYKYILKVFNKKDMASDIGSLLGVNKHEYPEKVINLLNGDCHDDIIAALIPYLPPEIPRR